MGEGAIDVRVKLEVLRLAAIVVREIKNIVILRLDYADQLHCGGILQFRDPSLTS